MRTLLGMWEAWPSEFRFWVVIIVVSAVLVFIETALKGNQGYRPPYQPNRRKYADHRPVEKKEPEVKQDPMIAQLRQAGFHVRIDAQGHITATHPDHKEI